MTEPLKVAEYLGQRDDAWDSVWRRFAEAPTSTRHIPDRLRGARPAPSKKGEGLFDRHDAWPQVNEEEESSLRAALAGAAALDAGAGAFAAPRARAGAPRPSLVGLGAPAAVAARRALVHLAGSPRHGPDPDRRDGECHGGDYARRGWQADDASMRALARSRPRGRCRRRGGDRLGLRRVARRRRDALSEGRGRRLREPSRRPIGPPARASSSATGFATTSGSDSSALR